MLRAEARISQTTLAERPPNWTWYRTDIPLSTERIELVKPRYPRQAVHGRAALQWFQERFPITPRKPDHQLAVQRGARTCGSYSRRSRRHKASIKRVAKDRHALLQEGREDGGGPSPTTLADK